MAKGSFSQRPSLSRLIGSGFAAAKTHLVRRSAAVQRLRRRA
jgi:hypothetical protein